MESNSGTVQRSTTIRRLWAQWKRFATWLGRWNTRILLSLTYVFMFGPIAVVLRLFGRDLLDRRWRPRRSYWKEIEPAEITLEGSRHQS